MLPGQLAAIWVNLQSEMQKDLYTNQMLALMADVHILYTAKTRFLLISLLLVVILLLLLLTTRYSYAYDALFIHVSCVSKVCFNMLRVCKARVRVF